MVILYSVAKGQAFSKKTFEAKKKSRWQPPLTTFYDQKSQASKDRWFDAASTLGQRRRRRTNVMAASDQNGVLDQMPESSTSQG